MKPTIVDSKELAMQGSVESPTYIVTSAASSDNKKGSVTKKHVLYAVSGVAVVALLLVAILVGMHMFSQAHKDIVKFSMQFKGTDDEDVKQEVESDPNDNVVMYHVTKAGQDAYVVNDFNKGMQVVKMTSSNMVSCFITALNKSNSMDTSYITGQDSMNGKDGNREESFMIATDPVADRSFLSKKAQDLCKGVSVYWVTKQCSHPLPSNTTGSGERTKRAIYHLPQVYGMYGLGGCCKRYYACELVMLETIQGTLHLCQTYFRTGTCCTPNAVYPNGVPFPYCNNVYSGPWQTPGLIC